MGRPLHFDDIKEFHCVYRLFLFDIFKAKDQERMKVEQSRRGNRATADRESKKSISQPRHDDDDDVEEEEGGTARKKR